ncbi:hypothetical protein ABPG72_001286 [Tetrahymena utriculariae]
MNRKQVNYSPGMSLQYSQHPLTQSALQANNNTLGLNNRQQPIVNLNSPMQPYPINYHNKTIQQKQQLMQNQQQLLNFGGRNYKIGNAEFDFQADQKYKNKSKTSLDQYQNQALTPKQISLLDKIENIKKKGGYIDEKTQKFPPLSQLQFPNLHSYVEEKPMSEGNKPSVANGLNPSFNQKNGMVNTFNSYRKENDNLSIRNPYIQNNPYSKPVIDSYNKGGNISTIQKLPKLDNTPHNINNNTSNNQYQNQHPMAHDENTVDKRKKFTSYDINVHNSQLLHKMMENNTSNPQSTSNQNHTSSINLMSTNNQNILKPYQNTLSPIKKYGITPSRYTPDKQNLGATNNFNSQPSQFKEEANVTSNQMFRYSMKTKAGCTINKVTKTNQDSAIVNPKILSDINIFQFAVGDGHGLNGHLVSQLIKKNLPKNVHKFLKPDDYSPDNMKNAINRGFYTTNHEIFAADFDCNLSGSTLISVFIHENKLYCANVGDSRAVIGKQKTNTAGYKAHPLSTDHKPSLERERLRIIKNGGRVDCQRDYTGQPLGPLRVWLQNMDLPGLAMTRSMGDKVGVQAGVIADPEFEEMEITEEDKFMVVASDGVWEYLSDQEVIKLVGQFYERGLVEQAAEKLITESTNAWKRESLVRDDITCIVVFFNHKKF